MVARLIDGKAFAQGLRTRVGEVAQRLKADHGVVPGLAVNGPRGETSHP